MTREEVIQILKILKEDYWDDDGYGHETKEYNDTMLALDMAIKAVKQESTAKNDLGIEECVNKAEFVKKLENETIGLQSWQKALVYQIMDDCHSVTPQEPRWIPVSERLPENKETVLVAFKHFVSGNTIGLGSVILLRGKPHWHVREQDLGTYDVLAWMPLPKAYREMQSNKVGWSSLENVREKVERGNEE